MLKLHQTRIDMNELFIARFIFNRIEYVKRMYIKIFRADRLIKINITSNEREQYVNIIHKSINISSMPIDFRFY